MKEREREREREKERERKRERRENSFLRKRTQMNLHEFTFQSLNEQAPKYCLILLHLADVCKICDNSATQRDDIEVP